MTRNDLDCLFVHSPLDVLRHERRGALDEQHGPRRGHAVTAAVAAQHTGAGHPAEEPLYWYRLCELQSQENDLCSRKPANRKSSPLPCHE